MKLTKTEEIALLDCAQFADNQYCWKPATMARLVKKGLATQAGSYSTLTEAGKKLAAELKGPK